MATQKKEKLLIENLLSSRDVFSRCINIVKPDYFDQPEYRPVIKFVTEYFNKYNNVPPFDIVNAEHDTEFAKREITTDLYNYSCDEIEQFCKQSAFINAVRDSYTDLDENEFDKAYKRISDAMLVSLQRDMGVELYENPEEYLKGLLDTEINHPTLIKAIDDVLNGGMARKTFSLFSANSGVGKSNMLANLGVNYSLQGFNVLYISLELPEDMIYIRLSAISTAVNIALWKQRIPEIAGKLITRKNNGAGSYKVKRMRSGTTANDIRSYLKHYEIEYGYTPDVIIIDYLDLMHPNGGTKNKQVFDQDKEKSEEVTEILHDYNAIGISASQQNREALRLASPDQGVIAGGISKVNTVHNYISMAMTDEMLLRGEMLLHFLKTRSSSGRGQTIMLGFDANTLIISDSTDEQKKSLVQIIQNKKKNNDKGKSGVKNPELNKKLSSIIGDIKGMPATKGVAEAPTEKEKFLHAIDMETGEILAENIDIHANALAELGISTEPDSDDSGDELLDLMNSFGSMK